LRALRKRSALRRKRIDHRSDVQPRRLAQIARLAAVFAWNRDDQVVSVDDDFRAGNAQTVDPVADDLLRLSQCLPGGPRSVRGACGQRDSGAALQVDAELRGGPLVSGEEHQQVDADEQDQE
jgi:hypothetical protein